MIDLLNRNGRALRTHFHLRRKQPNRHRQPKNHQQLARLYLFLSKKERTIALNPRLLGALKQCYLHRRGDYIFANNRKEPKAISRVQAWRIIHTAVVELGIMGKIACHSLRKTWGYHAIIDGDVSLAVVVDIYNHSSYETTKLYLGIRQDEQDEAILKMTLF